MRIYNYDAQRAEASKQKNDKKVKQYNRFERTFFLVRSFILLVISLCVVAMSGCILVALILEPTISSSPIFFGMVAFTGLSLCMTLHFIVTRKKANYIESTHYDNLETQYHRLNSNYNIVNMTLDETNNVYFVCEKDRYVEAFALKPRFVKTTKKLTTPTLDVQHDCLWLPV